MILQMGVKTESDDLNDVHAQKGKKWNKKKIDLVGVYPKGILN